MYDIRRSCHRPEKRERFLASHITFNGGGVKAEALFARRCRHHTGRPYFVEVKRPGTYDSPDQKEFQRNAETAGASCDGP
jgi:hypothetical protein